MRLVGSEEKLNRGVYIRNFRKKARLNQAELAHLLNVHETTIRRWERGGGEPDLSELAKLCKVLDVSSDDLLNGPAEETREFTLVYDREGDLRMEVLNMAANAPEQRVMSVSRERIAALINIKTSHLPREVAKQTMLDEMAARFDEAWAQQEKWKEAGA